MLVRMSDFHYNNNVSVISETNIYNTTTLLIQTATSDAATRSVKGLIQHLTVRHDSVEEVR